MVVGKLKERQCALEGQAQYVNVWGVHGSVHCKGVYRVGEWTLGVQNFLDWFELIRNNQKSHVEHVIKIDQSQITYSKIASQGKMPLTAK